MSVLKLSRIYPRNRIKIRNFSSVLPQDEYTATPQYPPILDLSPEKRKERQQEAVWDELRAVKSVEEKQIKLNMPRYYGFKSYMLREDHIPYNNLELIQFATRTYLIERGTLPEFYNTIKPDENLLNSIQNQLEDMIFFELEGFKQIHDLKQHDLEKNLINEIVTTSLAKQLNRVLINTLSPSYPHLKNAYIDFNTRIESCWYVGGMKPPLLVKKAKLGQAWMKDKADDPVDRLMYYTGGACVALRSNQPLNSVISLSQVENGDYAIPKVEYDPRTAGIATEQRHIANIPGYWPGDPYPFGLLSIHKKKPVSSMNIQPEEQEVARLRQGVLAAFGWLNAQANLLGFNTFNDITYPLVTQTIITDGQSWSFFTYQLSTLINHSRYVQDNPKTNICWATKEAKLYESISNGKVEGFNQEVLGNLLRFYCNAPEERLGVHLTPFLSQHEKLAADYTDDEKREWLEREYKFLVSNRPRLIPAYEIYAWEKIYKIDHKTRFMDKKLRPFELGLNPYKRRLDERLPKYIPRALRPHLPRHKGRRANEYFP